MVQTESIYMSASIQAKNNTILSSTLSRMGQRRPINGVNWAKTCHFVFTNIIFLFECTCTLNTHFFNFPKTVATWCKKMKLVIKKQNGKTISYLRCCDIRQHQKNAKFKISAYNIYVLCLRTYSCVRLYNVWFSHQKLLSWGMAGLY